MLVNSPDNFEGEDAVDDSYEYGGRVHGGHGVSGEEAGDHPTPRVSPEIHLRRDKYKI